MLYGDFELLFWNLGFENPVNQLKTNSGGDCTLQIEDCFWADLFAQTGNPGNPAQNRELGIVAGIANSISANHADLKQLEGKDLQRRVRSAFLVALGTAKSSRRGQPGSREDSPFN